MHGWNDRDGMGGKFGQVLVEEEVSAYCPMLPCDAHDSIDCNLSFELIFHYSPLHLMKCREKCHSDPNPPFSSSPFFILLFPLVKKVYPITPIGGKTQNILNYCSPVSTIKF